MPAPLEVVAQPNSHSLAPEDLESLRRLDWRYLLPDPMLRDAACIAPADSSLTLALQRHFPWVKLLNPSASTGRKFAGVVVGGATTASVRAACDWLADGGWIYAEFSRGLRSLPGSLLYPQRCRREFCRLGFRAVTAHWHRPNFEDCWEFIPLFSDPAIDFAMSRSSPTLCSRAKFTMGRLLYRSGLLPIVIPCFSMLARKDVQRNESRPQLLG